MPMWSVDDIADLIRKQYSTRDIARRLRCPPERVEEIRKSLREDTRSNWSEPEIEVLLALFHKGMSGSQIACNLNARFELKRSRNSIISQIHRLRRLGRIGNAPAKTRVQMREQTRPGATAAKAAKRKLAKTVAKAANLLPHMPLTRLQTVEHLHATEATDLKGDEDITPDKRVPLEKRLDTGCKWPVGDPLQPDFGYCPEKHVAGLPYCERHARRAYLPVEPRRKRRASEAPVAAPTNETEFA